MKDGTIKPREKAEKKQETDPVSPPEISRFDKINEETFALTHASHPSRSNEWNIIAKMNFLCRAEIPIILSSVDNCQLDCSQGAESKSNSAPRKMSMKETTNKRWRYSNSYKSSSRSSNPHKFPSKSLSSRYYNERTQYYMWR